MAETTGFRYVRKMKWNLVGRGIYLLHQTPYFFTISASRFWPDLGPQDLGQT